MNRLKATILAIVALLTVGAGSVQAQTDPQITQYWAVPTLYNPAATGSTDFLRIRGAARLQWMGIHNAPQSFLALADTPLKLGKKRIGLGVNMNSETLGLFNNLGIDLQASYKFKFLKGELSVGVQGGYFNQKFKGSEIVTPEGDDYHQSTDEALPTQDLTGHTFDLSAGLWWSRKNVYFGVGGRHLLQPDVTMNVEGTESTEAQEFYSTLVRTVYFTGGGNIAIKNTLFELQPSFLVKTDFAGFTAEVTARGVYNHFLSAAVGYRWKDAVSLSLGVEIKNFFLGYCYEYPLSAIAKASSGTHELVAGYSLKLDFSGKNKNKHRSIRIM